MEFFFLFSSRSSILFLFFSSPCTIIKLLKRACLLIFPISQHRVARILIKSTDIKYTSMKRVIWDHDSNETNPSHYAIPSSQLSWTDLLIEHRSFTGKLHCFNLTIVLFLFPFPLHIIPRAIKFPRPGWMQADMFRGRGWRGISRFVTTILVGGNDRGWSMDRPCGRSEKIGGGGKRFRFDPPPTPQQSMGVGRRPFVSCSPLFSSPCVPSDRKNSNNFVWRRASFIIYFIIIFIIWRIRLISSCVIEAWKIRIGFLMSFSLFFGSPCEKKIVRIAWNIDKCIFTRWVIKQM